MASLKRSHSDPDPKYEPETIKKIKTESEAQSSKLVEIINREFKTELSLKEKEIEEIENQLLIARKTLHLFRYVCVTSFYNRNQLIINSQNTSVPQLSGNDDILSKGVQKRLHPAVKKLIGKAPITFQTSRTRRKQIETETSANKIRLEVSLKNKNSNNSPVKNEKQAECSDREKTDHSPVTFSGESSTASSTNSSPTRNQRYMTKYRIVVGNISKYMPSDNKFDKSTHKWMVYVRGPRENPDISKFVKKVRFFLHPSYRPNDVVEVTNPPFHLARRGWGEFPLRIQMHFQNSLNKPRDVIHNIKLDRRCTGLQTLGTESLIDVWLYNDKSKPRITARRNLRNFNELKDDCFIESSVFSHSTKNNEVYIKEEPKDNEFCEENNTVNNIKNKSVSESLNLSQTVIFNSVQDKNNVAPLHQTAEAKNKSDCFIKQKVSAAINKQNDSNEKVVKNGKIYLRNPLLLKPQVSLLKTCLKKQGVNLLKNEHGNSILVIVNSIEEIHNYCKPIVKSPKIKNFVPCQSVNNKKYEIDFDKSKFAYTKSAVSYLLQKLPLISKAAVDPTYKKMYPYIAVSQEQFLSWHIAKRRCAEWYRAKTIKQFLTDIKFPSIENWTVKSIIRYSRIYGFVPGNLPHSTCSQKTIPEESKDDKLNVNTYSVPKDMNDWLENCIPQNLNHSFDEEIDILNVTETKSDTKNNKSQSKTYKEAEYVIMEGRTDPSNEFIKAEASKLGFVTGPEEIEPGIWCNAASTVLATSMNCLVNELVRASLANYLSKESSDPEVTITDVLSAFKNRPEFDIFLNKGLGKCTDYKI